MKKQLLFLVLVISGLSVFAQSSVSGTVSDAASGDPLVGVSVSVVGTTNGIMTDIDGVYKLNNVAADAVVRFSSIGYATKDIVFAGESKINVTLDTDAEMLEDVIVIAYGTSKKSTFVGSATQVDMTAMESKPSASFTDALQGASSGVSVISASGDPGSGSQLRIRGVGSINASSRPLYVIDGVPVSGGNMSQLADEDYPDDVATTDIMSTINPSDILSLTVLKDASATSIYGSRAANGVVVITTKQGKKGRAKISFDYKVNFSELPSQGYDNMNSAEWYKTYFDAYIKDGKSVEDAHLQTRLALGNHNPYSNESPLDASGNVVGDSEIIIDTDWSDIVFRQAKTSDYNFSVSGASDKTRYFISMGYSDMEGIINGTDFDRISLRTNVNSELTDYFTLGTTTALSYVHQVRTVGGGAGASATGNAILYPNGVPMYDTNGDFNFSNPVTMDFNPIFTIENDIYDTKNYRVLTNVYGIIDLGFLVEGLSYRGDASVDFNSTDDFQFYNPFHGNGPSVNGRGYQYATWSTNWQISNKMMYETSINDTHNFNLLVGYEASENEEQTSYAQITQYATYGDVVQPELSNGAAPEAASSNNIQSALTSILAKVDYDLADKYYVTATYRRDGSSRFGANNRYGDFYSVGASWRVSEEEMFQNIDQIDNLKLRASYGTSGNDQVGEYTHLGEFSSWNYDGSPGKALYLPVNEDLQWETNKSLTVGVDYSILDSRLSGSIEYYSRTTAELLYDAPVSMITGFSSVTSNIASMKNYGFEFSVDAQIIEKDDISWSLGFNVTHNTNEMIDLPSDEFVTDSKRWTMGSDLFQYYLYQYAGVDSANGDALWYTGEVDEDGTKETTSNFNNAVREDSGSAAADFFGGVNTSFRYKNFTVGADLYYSVGGYILDDVESDIFNDGNEMGKQLSRKTLDQWSESNTDGSVPEFRVNNSSSSNQSYSTRYLYDASYIKLKSLSVNYSFSSAITDKMMISKLSIFAAGNNLLTITKGDFEGYDPEVGTDGITKYITPNPRTYTFGVKIGF